MGITSFFLKNGYDIQHGDTLEQLKQLPDNSVDSIVTDPPYGLKFMGSKWDVSVPKVEVWQECLRVLKPGGHLLAFAGTRTQHRMATHIEDAGFFIFDMLAWIYGTGYPKSHNVSKAIDKAAGVEREVIGSREVGPDITGRNYGNGQGRKVADITVPSTDEAKFWEGWGTALKPAMEPITFARKPLEGTVAENVLTYGTGALNINGCLIPLAGEEDKDQFIWNHSNFDRLPEGHHANKQLHDGGWKYKQKSEIPSGRWPANVIHDGSDEVLAHFPITTSGSGNIRKSSGSDQQGNTGAAYGKESRPAGTQMISYGDTGSAARFFYCAKASRSDRNEGLESSNTPLLSQQATMRERETADWALRNGNFHPTVKPTSLMRWMVRLVTPPGGICLDPYCGSGTTGKAAILEGFKFIGFDQDFDYVTISRKRCKHAGLQPDLFGGAA